jgi:hypothetical protein
MRADAGVEEGEIAEGSGTADAQGLGENLASVEAGPEDLVKPGTCFMGRSLITQAELDTLVSKDCFSPDDCRPPGRETTLKPWSNESIVFRDFFTAGLRLLVSKRFIEILAAYNVQIHQLTPNSIPQILKFLWACHSFAGTNEVDTSIRHFEIH